MHAKTLQPAHLRKSFRITRFRLQRCVTSLRSCAAGARRTCSRLEITAARRSSAICRLCSIVSVAISLDMLQHLKLQQAVARGCVLNGGGTGGAPPCRAAVVLQELNRITVQYYSATPPVFVHGRRMQTLPKHLHNCFSEATRTNCFSEAARTNCFSEATWRAHLSAFYLRLFTRVFRAISLHSHTASSSAGDQRKPKRAPRWR
jgi:hypothetical protein